MSFILTLLYIVLAAFAIVLMIVLFVPIHLLADSSRSLFGIRMTAVAEVMLRLVESEPVLDLWCLGYRRRIFLLKMLREQFAARRSKKERAAIEQSKREEESKHKNDAASNQQSTTAKKRKIPWQRIWSCLHSFRMRRMDLCIDTGIDEWNACLYPIAYFLAQTTPMRVQPNFNGTNSVDIDIHNTVGRLLWAFTFPKFFIHDSIHHSRRAV